MITFSRILQSDNAHTHTLRKFWWGYLLLPALLLLPMMTPMAGRPPYWQFLRWTLGMAYIARIVCMFGYSLKIVGKENPADLQAYWRVRPFFPSEILIAKLWQITSRMLLPLAGCIALELFFLNRGPFPLRTFAIIFLTHSAAALLIFPIVLGAKNDREAILCLMGLPYLLSLQFDPNAFLNRTFRVINASMYQVLPHGIPLRFILVSFWLLLAAVWTWERYKAPHPAWQGWLKFGIFALLAKPIFTFNAPPRLQETAASADFWFQDTQVYSSVQRRTPNSISFHIPLNPQAFSRNDGVPRGLRLETIHSIMPNGRRLLPSGDVEVLYSHDMIGEDPSGSLALSRLVPSRFLTDAEGLFQVWFRETPLHLVTSHTLPLKPGAQFTVPGASYHIQEVEKTRGGRVHIDVNFFESLAVHPARRPEHHLILRHLQSGSAIAPDTRRISTMEFNGFFGSGRRSLVFQIGEENLSNFVLEVLTFAPGESTVRRIELPFHPPQSYNHAP